MTILVKQQRHKFILKLKNLLRPKKENCKESKISRRNNNKKIVNLFQKSNINHQL